MSRSRAEIAPPRAGTVASPSPVRWTLGHQSVGYGAMSFAAVAAITVARLIWLAAQPADLYPDEAQYWFWAQHLALGYYSKPPLIAWLIALTTGLFGDSEFAVRLAAPLLHAGTAALTYAITTRLYDSRIGFWSALTYASLPGTSLSGFIISTDAVLVPCWAAALYAFIRAREDGSGWGWWALAGIAAGLGLLAKYAMAYWLLSAALYVISTRGERRHLPRLLAASGLSVLLYLPNLWWNWSHGFVSYLHVRDNADIAGSLFHPAAFAEFFASQFGVVGPIVFAGLIAVVAWPAVLAEDRARLLAMFAFPTLAIMLALSLLSRAQPNWAAPAYVSAVVLVVAWAFERGLRRYVLASIALNLTAAMVMFGATGTLAAVGVTVPAKSDPLHRLRGWHRLGDEVGAALAAHPGLKLLADDREVLAALVYYVRPHPFDAAIWSPLPGIRDQWSLTNNLASQSGGDFLAVTIHGDMMGVNFAEFTRLGDITISPGPEGSRAYTLYIARGYRGMPAQRR